MKKKLYKILGVVSFLLFAFYAYSFLSVKNEYLEIVEEINKIREHENKPERAKFEDFQKPYTENKQSYALGAVLCLGLTLLSIKLVKHENRKEIIGKKGKLM